PAALHHNTGSLPCFVGRDLRLTKGQCLSRVVPPTTSPSLPECSHEDPGSAPSVPTASYPKPWLGAQPAAVVTPGVNVSLTCQAPQPAWRFALFKLGESAPLLFRDVSSELAEFFLEEVTPAQGGSYHCCYRRLGWGPGVWSQPSDALELLVTEELPRPSLVALPGSVVAPGATVSLRCAGRMPGMSFALYAREAAPLQYLDSQRSPGPTSPLTGAQALGTYSCYYHTPHAPYVLSPRSQPLVVHAHTGELALGSGPSPPPSCPGSGPQGLELTPSLPLTGSSSLDYTRGNLVRLGLAGLVLTSLCALVAFDCRSRRSALGHWS
uniref:Osteoclast associated Ig-like receptor n=1 Tax=Oryctolagus cuniculus TaxID=9986 RepID=G1TYT6_RABIT